MQYERPDGRFTRRAFLEAAALSGTSLAAACAPGASTPTPSPGASEGVREAGWEAEWQTLVAAAKQEGKLVAVTIAGAAAERQLLERFQDAFPGITAEQSSVASINIWGPKALQERQAGIYTWDVQWGGGVTANLGTYKPQGVYQPIRPFLMRPDVLDDTAWIGGFEEGFPDEEKQWAFGFTLSKGGGVYINTDLVSAAELRSVRDLLDPRWKGRMVWADPRNYGAGYWAATAMRLAIGNDSMRQMFVDQEPVLSRDARQIAEFIARGRYPAGVGPLTSVLQEMRSEGVAQNVKQVYLPEISYASSNALFVLDHAPHPNAAKLFVNWMLTQDALAFYGGQTRTNSRRKDVPVMDAEAVVNEEEARRLFRPDREARIATIEETQKIATDLLK